MGAQYPVAGVDLPRCGPMLSPRVPNLVPIPGPRMERVTPGQRPRPNYGHPQVRMGAAFHRVLIADELLTDARDAGDQRRDARCGIRRV